MAYDDSRRTASELTGIARAVFETVYNSFTFAPYFPLVESTSIYFDLPQTVLATAAPASKLTGWNTTAPRGDEKAVGQIVQGRTVRTSESSWIDEIRLSPAWSSDQMDNWLDTRARTLGAKFANRLLMMVGEILETGEIDFTESGYKQKIKFNRPASHNVTLTAANRWTAEGSNPLGDARAWRELTKGGNAIYLSDQVMQSLTHNVDLIKRVLRRGSDLVAEISQAEVKDVFAADGFVLRVLPTEQNGIVSYDGTVTYIIPQNQVYVLPASNMDAVFGSAIGETQIAPTTESASPQYGINEAERPGVFCAAFHHEDPEGYNVLGSAEFLPKLRAPHAILKAKVAA